MGSYNVSCGLTDLPIYPTEEVYGLFLLQKNSLDVQFTESTINFMVIPYMTTYIYDDYGRFEFNNENEKNLLLDFLTTHILKTKNYDGHGNDLKAEDINEYTIFRLMDKQQLFINDPVNGIVNLCFMPIKKSVLEKFFKAKSIETICRLGENKELYYKEVNRDNYFDLILNEYNHDNLPPDRIIFENLDKRDLYYRPSVNKEFPIERLIDFCFLHGVMRIMNKIYKPMMYAYEDLEENCYKLLNKAIEEEIENINHQWDD